jgi:hypothetical protein
MKINNTTKHNKIYFINKTGANIYNEITMSSDNNIKLNYIELKSEDKIYAGT